MILKNDLKNKNLKKVPLAYKNKSYFGDCCRCGFDKIILGLLFRNSMVARTNWPSLSSNAAKESDKEQETMGESRSNGRCSNWFIPSKSQMPKGQTCRINRILLSPSPRRTLPGEKNTFKKYCGIVFLINTIYDPLRTLEVIITILLMS